MIIIHDYNRGHEGLGHIQLGHEGLGICNGGMRDWAHKGDLGRNGDMKCKSCYLPVKVKHTNIQLTCDR